MLCLGIIGCGRIVAEGHAPALRNLKSLVRVVAVADISAKRTQIVGEILGVERAHRYSDFREMLRRETLDCVDLAVPHFLHESVAIACVRRGLHIFVEKPLSISVESAKRVLETAATMGVAVGIAHNYTYKQTYLRAMDEIASGGIGRPFLIERRSLGGSYYRGVADYDSDWRTRRGLGGGVLWDDVYHEIYAAETVMGTPVVKVSGHVCSLGGQWDVDDTALVLLHHGNGGLTSLQISWAIPGGGSSATEIHCTKGSLRLCEQAGKPLEMFLNDGGEWRPLEVATSRYVNSFHGVFFDFLTSVAAGKQPKQGGAEALHNLAVIEAMCRASSQERAISI